MSIQIDYNDENIEKFNKDYNENKHYICSMCHDNLIKDNDNRIKELYKDKNLIDITKYDILDSNNTDAWKN